LFITFIVIWKIPRQENLQLTEFILKKNPDGGPDIIKVDGPTVDDQPMPK